MSASTKTRAKPAQGRRTPPPVSCISGDETHSCSGMRAPVDFLPHGGSAHGAVLAAPVCADPQRQGRTRPAQCRQRPAQDQRKISARTGAVPARQVVQIAIAATADEGGRAQYFVALCDDGTLWRYVPDTGAGYAARWQPMLLPPRCEVAQ